MRQLDSGDEGGGVVTWVRRLSSFRPLSSSILTVGIGATTVVSLPLLVFGTVVVVVVVVEAMVVDGAMVVDVAIVVVATRPFPTSSAGGRLVCAAPDTVRENASTGAAATDSTAAPMSVRRAAANRRAGGRRRAEAPGSGSLTLWPMSSFSTCRIPILVHLF